MVSPPLTYYLPAAFSLQANDRLLQHCTKEVTSSYLKNKYGFFCCKGLYSRLVKEKFNLGK